MIEEINDNKVCVGDIVEFNPIGSTGVKTGKVIKFQRTFVIQVSEKPFAYYDFDSVFGKVKVIKYY